MQTKITANKPNVVSEDFEDEVILVSLVNGNYYSLRGTAAAIWKIVEQGVETASLKEAFSSSYGLDAGQLSAFDTFLEQLQEHQLIKHLAIDTSIVDITVNTDQPYENPIVEAYSDMQDLLLLDPIHDVDEETGWPAKPAPDTDKEN